VLEDARSVADAADSLPVDPVPAGPTDAWPVLAGLAGMSRI
jgi:hypothetical protein